MKKPPLTAEDVLALLWQLDKKPITADVTGSWTWQDAGFDSLDLHEFALDMEEKFGIVIPDNDLKTTLTIDEFVSRVNALRRAQKIKEHP